MIKKVNLWILHKKVLRIIFNKSINKNVNNNFIFFKKLKDLSSSKFDNYN